jgi:D-alanyl-D-alanine carboxypeptidase
MNRIIRWCGSWLALVVVLGWLAHGQQVLMGGPPPEIRNHIDSFVKALNSSTPDTWEKMAQEHFTSGQLKRQTVEERKQAYENIRRDFGTITLGRVEGPDQPLRLHIKGSTGASGVIELTLENDPPFAIEKIGVRIGGPSGNGPEESVEPPRVNGTMPEEQLTAVLNDYLRELAAKDVFSGGVLIGREGKTIYAGSAGFADRSNKLQNGPSTRFNVGSIDKTFTKTAIEQLVARGKISLNDTIGKLLPDYPQAESRTATVDQLLHHSAGIADVFGEEFDHASKDRFRSNSDYYKFVSRAKPMFSPGARTQYCNGCYVVLGAIIERISAMPYERYVEENIFKPAGMKSTGFLQSDGINPDVAVGYTHPKHGATLESNVLMNGAAGCAAGGGYSSPGDLFYYSEALRTKRIPDVASSENLNIGGGAPGINAVVQQSGPWTVVVMANLDPPSAEIIGSALARALSR